MLLSEKTEGKACKLLYQTYFNNRAEPMIYGRGRVIIVDRIRGISHERSTRNEFQSKNITNKRKHYNTFDKALKKTLT